MSDPTQSPTIRPVRLFMAFLGPAAWRRAVGDHVARVGAVTDELARIEARNLTLAHALVDESARLAHATLAWSAQVSAAWQGVMSAAARHTLDLVRPGDR